MSAEADSPVNSTGHFKAFLSYSWADISYARALHKWLEQYRLPKKLAKEKKINREIGKIFRDETDLNASPEAWLAIQKRIVASESLIVLCSPDSAKSEWVDKEIRHFRSTGRGEKIFAVIVRGTPNSGDPNTECLPPAFRKSEPGGIEPLAANIAIDGKERAHVRVAASLFSDLAFDDLWQRERRRQRWKAAVGSGLMAVGLVLAAAAAAMGWIALQRLEQIAHAKSDLIAREADAIGLAGNNETALLMALQADPSARSAAVPKIFAPQGGYAQARLSMMAAYESLHLDTVLKPIDERIDAAVISPAEQVIIWGEQTGRIVDIKTGATVKEITTGPEEIVGAALSADGRFALTTSDDAPTRIWDIAAESLITNMPEHWDGGAASFSPDGSLVLFGSSDAANIWETTPGGRQKPLRGFKGKITAVAFSPDGRFVVVGSNEGAELWDVSTGISRYKLEDQVHSYCAESVRSVAFSGTGEILITNGPDSCLRFWEVASGKLSKAVLISSRNSVVAFSPDGHRIATASEKGVVQVLDADSLAILKTVDDKASGVSTITFSGDGRRVVTTSREKIRIYDASIASDVTPPLVFEERENDPAKTDYYGVAIATFSASGKQIATFKDGTVGVWSTTTRHLQKSWKVSRPVNSLIFTYDDRSLLVRRWDEIEIWDIQSETLRGTLKCRQRWSPPEFFAAVAAEHARDEQAGTKSSTTCDTTEAQYLASLNTHQRQDPITTFFSADLSRAVTWESSGTAIWNVEKSSIVNKYNPIMEVVSATFARAMPILAVAYKEYRRNWGYDYKDHVRVWDAANGKVLANIPVEVNDLVLSRDGSLLLTASERGAADLWHVATGRRLATLEGHAKAVNSVDFAPDGQSLLTGSRDRTARIWTLPRMLIEDASTQIKHACEKLAKANAPLAFTAAQVVAYPVLVGEPEDAATGDFVSPCEGILSAEILSASRKIWGTPPR